MFENDDADETHNQVATYTVGGITEWREVEGGWLPQQRYGLRAATIDNVIFITGGIDNDYEHLSSILSWDPSAESWQPAGNLSVARSRHAAVAVPSSILQSKCLNVFTT